MQTLEEVRLTAADAIGDVIEHWGFRKSLGRVWTIIYLAGEPVSTSTLGEKLQMSSGSVSMALSELRKWGVVKRVWRPGERRDFFEAETDFWKMISRVINERERALVRSVCERLEGAARALDPKKATGEERALFERIQQLLSFAKVAENLIEAFVASQRVDFSPFSKLLWRTSKRG